MKVALCPFSFDQLNDYLKYIIITGIFLLYFSHKVKSYDHRFNSMI